MEDEKIDAKIMAQQLAELNSRSRWYSAQIWYLPFAFFTLAGIVLASLARQPSHLKLGWGLIGLAIVGAWLLWHGLNLRDGEKRAVVALSKLEEKLGFDTAKYKPQYGLVVLGVIAVSIIVFVAASICAFTH